jgi:hypothetical protein
MPTAYTPGLMITGNTLVRAERLLPIRGEVLVSEGQSVTADTPIARALRPGNLTSVKVTERLGIDPSDLPGVMLKKEGEQVEAGELIGETRGFFGLFHNTCESPVAGVIEHISPISGYVGIREPPMPLEAVAHISGRVARIVEGQGAVVETRAALVQGIFGVGGERRGALVVAAQGANAPLDVALAEEPKGAVLVGGATADGQSLAAAARAGAAGVVVGSVDDVDLRTFVGYDIGVAVTGQEQVPFTLIITEGFGRVSMARATFDLLTSMAGREASINGATQIRAGVIRPEVIVPLGPEAGGRPDSSEGGVESAGQLAVGSEVRLIREPYFGQLAVVTALPSEPQRIETEALVRVAEVELGDGTRTLVPRANVEMVHG